MGNKKKLVNFDESNFILEYSKAINKNAIDYLNNRIDYNVYVNKLKLLGLSEKISRGIVNGICEYALVTITNKSYENEYSEFIFYDKFRMLYDNINPNSRISNKNFIEDIKSETFSPQLVPFLSPDQIFPEHWVNIHKKIEKREEAVKNMATTDQYECKYCHSRRSRVTQFQIRCADEPMTTFITCMNCYRTSKR